MLTRRELVKYGAKAGAALALWPGACAPKPPGPTGVWVNDVHSELNATRVASITRPDSLPALQRVVAQAKASGRALSIAAGRHAMGGQQFGTDSVLLDVSGMDQVLSFDRDKGEIEAGAGIRWPELVQYLVDAQAREPQSWGILQKQTGADRLSLGGALAANAHGRGLRFKPIVADVAAFTLVDSQGAAIRCSREQNPELFRLAIGGYGLFGILASVRLRLGRRQKLERVVEIIESADLPERFAGRINDGYLYGDFQFSTDFDSDDLLRKGVFSCYRPAGPSAQVPDRQTELSRSDWAGLICLGHTRRGEAFKKYADYYLSTSGQIYWSDTHQLSEYIDHYHLELSGCLGRLAGGTEMITEIYVPRQALPGFLEAIRGDVVDRKMNLIYGTIRLIEPDDESFLAWAREPFACVIFNLHVGHDAAGLRKAEADFQKLIDRGIERRGSYYLTYHRWATRDQVVACYPQFPEFLKLKKQHDPEERFQSDWYRHYRKMFQDMI